MKKRILTVIAVAGLLFGFGDSTNAQEKDMKNETKFLQIFPQGEKNTAYAQYFTGQSYLAPLTQLKELNVPVSNVTFEPGCRNNWHSHTGGQLLIVTAGRGYYQEEGKPARDLLPGDVVEIAPNVVHWHGAAPDSWFSHLAVTCNPQTNKSTWLGPVDDKQYAEATGTHLPDADARNLSAWNALLENDPELAGIFGNFAFGETQRYGELDTRTRILVTLASAIAQQATETYRLTLCAAMANGITPVEIKEVLYHAAPYVGMAKVVDFIGGTNDFLTANGVELPLESRSTTTPETRYEKGLALQKEIFGGQIEQMHKDAPENQKHIQHYLSANCFGDYQTRTGLDVRTRELLTFSILVSLGGCESQVKGHIRGNLNVGNGKDTLLAVVTQLLPYIGYPRTLNAVACLNEVVPDNE